MSATRNSTDHKSTFMTPSLLNNCYSLWETNAVSLADGTMDVAPGREEGHGWRSGPSIWRRAGEFPRDTLRQQAGRAWTYPCVASICRTHEGGPNGGWWLKQMDLLWLPIIGSLVRLHPLVHILFSSCFAVTASRSYKVWDAQLYCRLERSSSSSYWATSLMEMHAIPLVYILGPLGPHLKDISTEVP